MAVNSYVTLDLMRPNQTLIDLTNNFNGRVADSQSYLKIWVKSNGLPKDLSNNTVMFEGVDPNGTKFQIYGTAQADQTGDSLQTGRITFYFPAETFQVEGDWDDETTFLAVLDASGNRVSAQNVHLHVLADKVSMGINSGPFITDFEKVKQELIDWANGVKDDVSTALTMITDPNSTLLTTLKAVQQQVDSYTELVKNNTFLNVSDFNSFKNTVEAELAVTDMHKVTTAKAPSAYIANGAKPNWEFMPGAALGLSGAYYLVQTFVPFSDMNTAGPVQQATECTVGARPNTWLRVAKSTSAWGTFEQVTTW
ncbi:BppU family phage baseplate upper protein [Paucilactobacillus sp. N302-9]